jgi:hypothetical protein
VAWFGAPSIARLGKIKLNRAEQCSAFRLSGKPNAAQNEMRPTETETKLKNNYVITHS